jgi:hypothetical protein
LPDITKKNAVPVVFFLGSARARRFTSVEETVRSQCDFRSHCPRKEKKKHIQKNLTQGEKKLSDEQYLPRLSHFHLCD